MRRSRILPLALAAVPLAAAGAGFAACAPDAAALCDFGECVAADGSVQGVDASPGPDAPSSTDGAVQPETAPGDDAPGDDAPGSETAPPADGGGEAASGDDGPPSDAPICTPAPPDTTHGVFVSASASATTGCGAVDAPCATIASGIAAAQALGNKSVVYLDKGTYAEAVTLPAGLTLRGGWQYSGAGNWQEPCTADSSSLAVIAPTSSAVAVTANGGASGLDTLTVKSEPAAGTGESLYGVFATGGAALAMNAVVVNVATAGTGSNGSTGTAGSGTLACTTGTGGGGGGAGGGGAAGQEGSYDGAGYHPASGGTGTTGNAGNNGTGALGTPVNCTACTDGCLQAPVTITPGPPGPGCGGDPGNAGGGGGGGGSAIGVYAWGATVTVTGGSISIAGGGAGGPGGPGGKGAAGSTGSNGCNSADCGGHCDPKNACVQFTTTFACSDGGVGQTGGSGGAGGGGAGGDAYGSVSGGGGGVTTTGTAVTVPKTGAPGGAATNAGVTGQVAESATK